MLRATFLPWGTVEDMEFGRGWLGSRRRRRARRAAEPGSLEYVEAWGAQFFLRADERLYLQAVHSAQLIHLYPDEDGDGEFTPDEEDWDEIVSRLATLLAGPGEPRGDSLYEEDGFPSPYEGVVLKDPFDRTDRTPDPEARVDRSLLFVAKDRYYVHHGWVTLVRSGGEQRLWWPDPDRSLELFLLEMSQRYGMGEELRRRRIRP